MKVSVVIPAYNEELYIERTLLAVTRIDYPSYEIIVVDNGSTDATKTIVKSFPQVRLLEERRRGPHYAREYGRQEASGEIIANLDADCIPPPNWLTKGVSYFREGDSIVAVSGPCDFYDEGWYIRGTLFFTQNILLRTWHFIIHTLLRKGLVPIGGNTMYRADILEKAGGYNVSIPFHGDDTDTGMRVMKFGRIIYTPRLTIKSSARRFKRLGIFRTYGHYVINNLWMQMFKKPFHKSYSQ